MTRDEPDAAPLTAEEERELREKWSTFLAAIDADYHPSGIVPRLLATLAAIRSGSPTDAALPRSDEDRLAEHITVGIVSQDDSLGLSWNEAKLLGADIARRFRAASGSPEPVLDASLVSLAVDGAAQQHLQGWGIVDRHNGTLWECETRRCIEARATLERAGRTRPSDRPEVPNEG